MKDLSSLGWELLAWISRATGRLLDVAPDVAHERLINWLSEAEANVATAEAWLAFSRSEPSIDFSSHPPMRGDAIRELALRQPIEHAIWGEPEGGGVVGCVHAGKSPVWKWWLSWRHHR